MPDLEGRTPEQRDFPRVQRAEDIFDTLPAVEAGVDVPRVSVTRLTTGQDAVLKLSVKENLGRAGWDYEALRRAQKGETLMNKSGEIFGVVEVARGKIKIRHPENGSENEIIANAASIKAHTYDYKVGDRAKYSRKIRVYDTVYRDRSLETTDFIDDIVRSIPAQCIDVFDEIHIHRESGKAGSFRAEPSLLTERKVLTLYVSEEGHLTVGAIKILYHELGHAIAKFVKGSVHPGKRWRSAMDADGNAVSEYAERTKYPKDGDTGEIEDFADAVMMYLATDGAKRSEVLQLRSACGNRFRKIDEVLDDLADRQRLSMIARLAKGFLGSSSVLDK